jgi:predicted SnoaL-like aldol condensation-catalyzing enzyme
MATTPRALVLEANAALFGEKDLTAIDRYWAPTYIQHNPTVPNGPEGLKAVMGTLPILPSSTPHRVLADESLVAIHTTYTGFGPTPMVAFDLFRVENGKIAEHWDGLAPVAPPNPSGRTQTDGPTELTDLESTEANREMVTRFVETVLIGQQYDQLPVFIDADNYAQHNSGIADGLAGLGAAIEALGKQGIFMEYFTLHRVVAEGNFVLTQSEGAFGGAPTAYYDLFRVESGKIVEHWDVMQTIPAAETVPHTNGMF